MPETISKLRCLHCNWEWYPLRPQLPKICPRCHARNWQHPPVPPQHRGRGVQAYVESRKPCETGQEGE